MDAPQDHEAQGLEAQARRADRDRWLASRFIADEAQRADVVALYALDHELARIAPSVTEPMMAEIRLTWWREALEGLFAGRTPPGHPVLGSLAGIIPRRGLALEPFLAMVEARFSDIEAEPFADLAALQAHADGVTGAVMSLALAVLGQGDAQALRPAALAWTLARTAPERLPQAWPRGEARRLGLAALAQARRAARGLPVTAFPAVAHLALTGAHLAGRPPGELEARLGLTWAVLTGRI